MERSKRALLPVLTSGFWGWKGVWVLAAPPCSAQLYSHKQCLLLCSAPAVTSEHVTQATHPRTLCSACLVTAPMCSRRPKEQTTNCSMRVAMETTCSHRSNEQALETLGTGDAPSPTSTVDNASAALHNGSSTYMSGWSTFLETLAVPNTLTHHLFV